MLFKVLVNITTLMDDVRREDLYMHFANFVISAQQFKLENLFWFKMLIDKRKILLQYWHADGVA